MKKQNEKKPKSKTKPKKKTEKMSVAHRMFVDEYIRCGGNATKAYHKVFGVKKNSFVTAHRLLKIPGIAEAIEVELSKYWKVRDMDMAKGLIFKKMSFIADACVDDMFNGDYSLKDLNDVPPEAVFAIKKMNVLRTETQVGDNATVVETKIAVEMYDKLKALEIMAKIIKILDSKNEDRDIEIILIPAERPQPQEYEKIDEPLH